MNVIMWGKADCAPCQATKPWLEQMCTDTNTPFEYRDVGQPQHLDEAIRLGFRMVPVVWVLDEDGAAIYKAVGGLINPLAVGYRLVPPPSP